MDECAALSDIGFEDFLSFRSSFACLPRGGSTQSTGLTLRRLCCCNCGFLTALKPDEQSTPRPRSRSLVSRAGACQNRRGWISSSSRRSYTGCSETVTFSKLTNQGIPTTRAERACACRPLLCWRSSVERHGFTRLRRRTIPRCLVCG